MSDTDDQRSRGDEPTDPTAPPEDVPAEWPPPAGEAPTYGTPPPPEYGAPPAYGPPPSYGPSPAYGEVAPYGPPQPYGQQPPGPADGYAPWPNAAPGTYGVPRRNGSALALTITSGILSVFCCSILTLPALVMGIVALAKQSTDPAGSARWARYGWIAFGVGILVTLAVLGTLLALNVGGAFDDPGYYRDY